MKNFSVLIILAAVFNFSLARANPSDASVEYRGLLQIVDNRHPVTGAPVFQRDGISFEDLEDHLDRYTYAAKHAPAKERERLTALYLRQVIDIPSRFGGAAGYYLKTAMYSTRDGRARFDFSASVQREVLPLAIADHFFAIRAAGIGSADFGYYKGIVKNFDLRDGALALVEIGNVLKTDDKLSARLRELGIALLDFERLCLSLVAEVIEQDARVANFGFASPAMIRALERVAKSPHETLAAKAKDLLESIEVNRVHFEKLMSGSDDYAISLWGEDGPRRCELLFGMMNIGR